MITIQIKTSSPTTMQESKPKTYDGNQNTKIICKWKYITHKNCEANKKHCVLGSQITRSQNLKLYPKHKIFHIRIGSMITYPNSLREIRM